MPEQLSFHEILEEIGPELHESRHLVVAFSGIPNEHPFLDLGWGAGVLFGIHLALQYPKLAVAIERGLFPVGERGTANSNEGADLIAQALRDRVVEIKPPTNDQVLKRYEELKAKRETEPAEEQWKLPEGPYPSWGSD